MQHFISPGGSELRRLFMAGKYSGDNRTWKSLSKGLNLRNASNPRVLRHRALKMLGNEDSTSRVAGTWTRFTLLNYLY